MQLVDGGAAVQDKTETAHLAVRNAEQEASRAQKEAGDVAARVSGPVAEKLIIESKGKATKACSDAKRKEEAMHKAKVALDAAAAEVKKSTSHENLQTIQSAHDKYQDAQRSSTTASSL